MAIVDYMHSQNQQYDNISNNLKILVIDFGGGTLDIACCVNNNGNLEILQTGGNKTHAHDSGSLVADIGAIGNDTTSIAYNAVNPARTKYNLGITGGGISGIDSKNVNHATSVSGTTDSTSSLPPYITVYIWVRTA